MNDVRALPFTTDISRVKSLRTARVSQIQADTLILLEYKIVMESTFSMVSSSKDEHHSVEMKEHFFKSNSKNYNHKLM